MGAGKSFGAVATVDVVVVTLTDRWCLNFVSFFAPHYSFLQSACLADCIDYSEFITGERTEGKCTFFGFCLFCSVVVEQRGRTVDANRFGLSCHIKTAQFTVFASFVPKIVSIPSGALPLALIGALGFVNSGVACDEDGELVVAPVEQSNAVRTAIRYVFVFLPVASNLVSFIVKTKYPFTSAKQIQMTSAGITLHAKGFAAPDPITGEVVDSPKGFTAEEVKMGVDYDYFFIGEKRKIYLANGSMRAMVGALACSLVTGLAVFSVCVYAVVNTFYMLEIPSLSWAPSFLQIVAGLSLLYSCFTALRLKKAIQLSRKRTSFPRSFMQRWIAKCEGRGSFDDAANPLLSKPQEVLDALQAPDKAPSLGEIKKKQKKYAGSTRNFIVADEAEKDKILQRILETSEKDK